MGRWIAFASDRPGQIAETKADSRQIYVIDPMGGEARQVTKLDDGVDGYEWAPDSKTIAFTTKDPLSKAQKDRAERYGEYTVVDGDERMTHLWTVDVTAAPVARLQLQDKTSTSTGDCGSAVWGARGASADRRR